MKLYRSKIPIIANQCIERLVADGDIEVTHEQRAEAEADLEAIMNDYAQRDYALREAIKDHMASNHMPYDQRGRVRSRMSRDRGHPLGDDVERYLCRQFTEILMITPNVDEVYGEDKVIYRKLMEVIRSHDVDEGAIRDEARAQIKNLKEGSVEFEIAMRNAVIKVKKLKGLL